VGKAAWRWSREEWEEYDGGERRMGEAWFVMFVVEGRACWMGRVGGRGLVWCERVKRVMVVTCGYGFVLAGDSLVRRWVCIRRDECEKAEWDA
jgi:hypothetical protein